MTHKQLYTEQDIKLIVHMTSLLRYLFCFLCGSRHRYFCGDNLLVIIPQLLALGLMKVLNDTLRVRLSAVGNTGSPRCCEYLHSWREFVKRVVISHKRDVVFEGCVPERPKNDKV
jgi:hypothetical protein